LVFRIHWLGYVTVGTLYLVFRIHWLGYVTVGTMYSVFRIQSARLRYWRHIVFGFSHTIGSVTLLAAHCIRFFAYNRLVYVTGGTLYSVFRIQSTRLRYWRHIVFGFPHTFGSFTLLAAHCIRFFAYNRLGYVTGGTLYSVFRIQSARLRYWRHIVFGFPHTIGSVTLLAAYCIRFSAYIWLVYVTGGTLYSVFRIQSARYVTGGTLYSVFRIQSARYVTCGTLYSVFRIHLARLRYRRHIVFGFSHTFVRKLD
jgi:hypothetical protein